MHANMNAHYELIVITRQWDAFCVAFEAWQTHRDHVSVRVVIVCVRCRRCRCHWCDTFGFQSISLADALISFKAYR